MMFGRIRASPSPAECLEMEAPPSKLFKDDSLSIYEATLLKLKQGSRRSLASEHSSSPASEDSMDLESNGDSSEESRQLTGCSKQGMHTCSGDSSSISVCSSSNQEHKTGREVSIQFLFSRYNNSHRKQGFPCYKAYNS